MVELRSIPESIQNLSESSNDTIDELITASIDNFEETITTYQDLIEFKNEVLELETDAKQLRLDAIELRNDAVANPTLPGLAIIATNAEQAADIAELALIDANSEYVRLSSFINNPNEFSTSLPFSGIQTSDIEELSPTPPSVPSPNFDGASTIMSSVLSSSLSQNPLLHYFNRMLMGYELSGFKEFCPDINGYVFIFMLPPHLSGYKLDVHIDSPLGRVSKMFPFFGIDFTPPPTSIVTSSIPSRSGGINYGSEIEATGQLQITYIDNDSLQCFGYHKTWVNYIEDISRGLISPDSKYLDPLGTNFGEIDYATSAYIARFKPTSSIGWGDLVYIGKAVGIFPISLPDKEVIGRRDSNEITMLPFTYACTFYRQCTFGSPVEVHDWIIDELSTQCLSAYKM